MAWRAALGSSSSELWCTWGNMTGRRLDGTRNPRKLESLTVQAPPKQRPRLCAELRASLWCACGGLGLGWATWRLVTERAGRWKIRVEGRPAFLYEYPIFLYTSGPTASPCWRLLSLIRLAPFSDCLGPLQCWSVPHVQISSPPSALVALFVPLKRARGTGEDLSNLWSVCCFCFLASATVIPRAYRDEVFSSFKLHAHPRRK